MAALVPGRDREPSKRRVDDEKVARKVLNEATAATVRCPRRSRAVTVRPTKQQFKPAGYTACTRHANYASQAARNPAWLELGWPETPGW